MDVKILLINWNKLAELIIDYQIDVSTKPIYEFKQIGADCVDDLIHASLLLKK